MLLQNGEDVDDTKKNRSRPFRKQPLIFFTLGVVVFAFILMAEVFGGLTCFKNMKNASTTMTIVGSILAFVLIGSVFFYLFRHFKA